MEKTIIILNITKRFTRTGKGINEVTADDGQVYTIWDPDFSGELKRNNQITGQIVYGFYNNRKTQTFKPIREGSQVREESRGAGSSGMQTTTEILLNILAVNILHAQKKEINIDSVETLVDGLKESFGMLSESYSSEPKPNPRPTKTIQVEDDEYEEEDEEESIPSFKKGFDEDDEEEVVKPKTKESKIY